MNSQYRTYMKREIKKTYPLLIVGLLFLVFMAVITTSMTKGVYEGALLELSDHFTSRAVWGMGDVVNLFNKCSLWMKYFDLLYIGNSCVFGSTSTADIFA